MPWLFLFKFCTRFCTLLLDPRVPLASLGPRMPVACAEPERAIEDLPLPSTMSSPLIFGDGLREVRLLGGDAPLANSRF